MCHDGVSPREPQLAQDFENFSRTALPTLIEEQARTLLNDDSGISQDDLTTRVSDLVSVLLAKFRQSKTASDIHLMEREGATSAAAAAKADISMQQEGPIDDLNIQPLTQYRSSLSRHSNNLERPHTMPSPRVESFKVIEPLDTIPRIAFCECIYHDDYGFGEGQSGECTLLG